MNLIDRLVSPTVNLVYAGILVVLVVLSVQWGRGRWAPFAWLRVLRTAVSVVAAIATPFLLVATVNEVHGAMSYVQSAGHDSYVPGLSVDGERVRNIFAYDADGAPIEQVQLFDQNGEPLVTVGSRGAYDEWDPFFGGGGGPTPVAELVAGREPVWNIFPLREVGPDVPYSELYSKVNDGIAPSFPFVEVPPVPSSVETSSPTVEAEAAPTPTATPTEAPAP